MSITSIASEADQTPESSDAPGASGAPSVRKKRSRSRGGSRVKQAAAEAAGGGGVQEGRLKQDDPGPKEAGESPRPKPHGSRRRGSRSKSDKGAEQRGPEPDAALGEKPSEAAELGAEEREGVKKTRSRSSRGRGRKKPKPASLETALPQAGQAQAEPPLLPALPERMQTLPELKVEYLPAALADEAAPLSQERSRAEDGGQEEPVLPGDAPDAAHGPAGRKRGRSGGRGGKDAGKGGREAAKAKDEAQPAKGRRRMFVSVLSGEQVEVAVAEEGGLREYYVEMLHQAKVKGNIYKGVISNVDPNLQAAFVSYGAAKNGFLQIDEVHPEYYLNPHEPGSKGHKYPLIQKVLKSGQEILVQVVKEPSGSKGAFLTSYLSLPGRYLVLTPGREQIGVSRKVGDDTERSRLRETLDALKPGPGLGVIVRTVSEGANKTSLQRDLRFLKRVWQDVRKRGSSETAPALIYQELGLAARAVRDYLTEDIAELWVNDEEVAEQMRGIINLLFPKRADVLRLHSDSAQRLFERFGLLKQIAQVQSREVILPSGGRLVFDHTEALTAIDINSGRSGGKNNFEDMAFKINLEAAGHIPLQLRLRDIGGQIVVDFIEMRDSSHWREVEKVFRSGMKEDRARHDVGRISSFGLLEVVRQRLGSSAISLASEPCPHCKGTGIRRNMEWQAMQAMQAIQRLVSQNTEPGKTLVYADAGELIVYILNNKKEWLLDLEQEAGIKLELTPNL
ncbi:MAG: Rne/Rng family ribonuclease [Deltaproteobacteria bacterium]|jgi:ribonuclease E|nr:Rne/Rng family ribonuclease [Deltaproteobacteria bacterium]